MNAEKNEFVVMNNWETQQDSIFVFIHYGIEINYIRQTVDMCSQAVKSPKKH